MKNLKLFENFDKEDNYWRVQLSDYIKSNRRDLEKDADNISKADIEDVISSFDTKYETTGDHDAKFRFVGSHFGMDDDEIEKIIGTQ